MFTGFMFAAIVPAVLVARLLSPSRLAIEIDPYLAFDPRGMQFRSRYFSRSRLTGHSGTIVVTLRAHTSDEQNNLRNFRVRMANDGRIPTARPAVPYFSRTLQCDITADDLESNRFDDHLHPSHIVKSGPKRSKVNVEISFDFPFATAWYLHDYQYENIICGQFAHVIQDTQDPHARSHWENFGKVHRTDSTEEGRAFCLSQCQFREQCTLINKVEACGCRKPHPPASCR
jgi:hypothetical protein